MIVEFYEGEIADNQLLDAIEMAVPPRVGELVTFDVMGDRTRPLEVTSVLHVFQIRRPEIMIESRHVAIRCATRPT